MFRVLTNIQITQQGEGRTTVLNFDFVTNWNSDSSWRNLTDKGSLVLPKNLYYRDENNKPQPLSGRNVNIGGFTAKPLFLRGDKVKISSGYRYFNTAKREVTEVSTFFEGWITKVNSRTPIELELEDNMWKLKQVPVETHVFSSADTLEDIMKFILKGTGFTFKALTKTNFGSFTIGNETAAEVLSRLQKDYGFESYFRGNELRCGVLIYFEDEAVTERFKFQDNIITEELEYSRKDDIVLSAIAHNTITEETGKTTKDGKKKTRNKRLEVLVTIKNDKRQAKVIEHGDAPANIEGERRTFFFPGAKTVDELAELAFNQLQKYYYTGLKGRFTTFGLPYIKHGDNVLIEDRNLPERNGKYKVKEVNYSGGVSGIRQIINLDYKING